MTLLLFPLLVASVLAACAIGVSEADLLHPEPAGPLDSAALAAAAPGYRANEHRIARPGGAQLYAIHLTQPGAHTTVLYFGGNGYTIGRFGAWTASLFAPLGVDLILVDHRGYGLSTGTPTIAAMREDVLGVFDAVQARIAPGTRIVAHGHSLGSFGAGHLAANRALAGVVLESSATTAEEWSAANVPGIAKPFVRLQIEPGLQGQGNLPAMARIAEPLLVMTGAKDRITPPRLARALHAASPLPANAKRLLIVENASHVDVMTRTEAITAYRDFLANLQRR